MAEIKSNVTIETDQYYKCTVCGEDTPERDLSWCYNCEAELCGKCDCGHDAWTKEGN